MNRRQKADREPGDDNKRGSPRAFSSQRLSVIYQSIPHALPRKAIAAHAAGNPERRCRRLHLKLNYSRRRCGRRLKRAPLFRIPSMAKV
jgi:hypothetical protein